MKKQFITLQMGYSWSKMYGKTNDYFTTIIFTGDDVTSISHRGLYGSDDRINNALKDKGYKEIYISSDYGLITRSKAWKGFISEHEALQIINKTL